VAANQSKNSMGITANVKGTGHKYIFDGSVRRNIIRRFVRENILDTLRRDTHNNNTVAVYVLAPRSFGLLGSTLKQIESIDEASSEKFYIKTDTGGRITGRVGCLYSPPDKNDPIVRLELWI
jgi:hypothetical protein